MYHFNPHPRTEDDVIVDIIYMETEQISIHILARRMTLQPARASALMIHFNPHPRTEDDTTVFKTDMDEVLFQSTSSHGG